MVTWFEKLASKTGDLTGGLVGNSLELRTVNMIVLAYCSGVFMMCFVWSGGAVWLMW